MNFDFINTILFFIGSFIFTLCFIKRLNIANYFKLIDKPDQKRKLHKHNSALTGALSIFIFFIFLCIYNLIFNYEDNALIIIFICSSLIFIIGVYDDRNNLSPYLKLSLIAIIFLIFLNFNENFILKEIYFSSFNKKYTLSGYLDIFLTILCLLLLINALNLVVGINSLANLLVTIWLIYILFMSNNELSNIFILLVFFIFINNFFIYKGKYFLGNSGSLFYASITGMLTIYNYNILLLESKLPSVENIFIIFMIPGFDMFRLFLERILKNKNPFEADNNHLHHFLIKILSLRETLFIYFLLVISPIIVSNYFNLNKLLVIIISGILYLLLLIILKNFLSKTKNNKKSI